MIEKFVSPLEFASATETVLAVKRAHEARAEIAAARRVLQDAANWIVANAIDRCDNQVSSVAAAMNAASRLVKASAWFNRGVDPRAALNKFVLASHKNKTGELSSNEVWWTSLALEGAGLSHLWADNPTRYVPYDSRPNYRVLPWLYDLQKVLNNLAEKRGWGTRYTRDGSVEFIDDGGPDQYLWAEDSGSIWYRSSTWNTVAKFTYLGYSCWRTEIWHNEGPVCRYLELKGGEAESFDWSFPGAGKKLVA